MLRCRSTTIPSDYSNGWVLPRVKSNGWALDASDVFRWPDLASGTGEVVRLAEEER